MSYSPLGGSFPYLAAEGFSYWRTGPLWSNPVSPSPTSTPTHTTAIPSALCSTVWRNVALRQTTLAARCCNGWSPDTRTLAQTVPLSFSFSPSFPLSVPPFLRDGISYRRDAVLLYNHKPRLRDVAFASGTRFRKKKKNFRWNVGGNRAKESLAVHAMGVSFHGSI